MKNLILLLFFLLLSLSVQAVGRQRLNFNGGWLMRVGDIQGPEASCYDDAAWTKVSLPHAFNEAEAFKVSISQLSDTIVWYRKHFNIGEIEGRKFFIELEGVRFGADLWLNGHHIGLTENGVMASGFDLTPYIMKGANVLAVRCDNSWNYHERATGSTFQWNNKNFNANYGGIPKNVFLHITGKVYQTLPLYSSLRTTGVYIYGTDYDIPRREVTVHVESEVRNEDDQDHTVALTSRWIDAGVRPWPLSVVSPSRCMPVRRGHCLFRVVSMMSISGVGATAISIPFRQACVKSGMTPCAMSSLRARVSVRPVMLRVRYGSTTGC